MANDSITFYESRVLPGLTGCFSSCLAVVILFSDAPNYIRGLGVCFACFMAIICFRIYFRPRWVVRIENGKLLHQDLRTKSISDINLSEVTHARIEKKIVFDDGIGGITHLILQIQDETLRFWLPYLSVKPNSLAQAINARCKLETAGF
jgi:hypothetical protein